MILVPYNYHFVLWVVFVLSHKAKNIAVELINFAQGNLLWFGVTNSAIFPYPGLACKFGEIISEF